MENNWTEICAKCMEGDIEPHYCEYYGEPNGCNSPTYGKHPPTPSAAAMYSCLVKILAEMIDLGGIERGKKAYFSPDAIADEIRQALAAPPRNCDRFGSYTQAKAEWWKTEVLPRVDGVVSGAEPPFADWLFSPATEKEATNAD